MQQVTSHVLMIRPASFGYNEETALNNTFQTRPPDSQAEKILQNAVQEFDAFVEVLRNEGVDVTVIGDHTNPRKPDAVFPNNWISFHEEGTIITYPMYSKLRRNERREDIIQHIRERFQVSAKINFESSEAHHQYLEGTGSLVLDRVHRIAYACISDRTNNELVDDWCRKMNYTPHTFYAESNGKAIYHTNVMMAIATEISIACFECIPDPAERTDLQKSLEEHREVIEISEKQMQSFAGNMLALKSKSGDELMVMSSRAFQSLTDFQKRQIEKHCRIVTAPIPTIEDVGGGSARCMIAEVFLQPKEQE